MSRPLYGSALRAKRNDINYSNAEAQVHDAMPGLIATHLPALSGCPLDPEEFGAQVQNFQRFLRTEYPDIKRLKIAYEFLADFVAKGNEQGLWQLDIPAIIVSVSRTTTSRSHTNFKAGIRAGKLYQSWLHQLAIEKHSSDPETRLADVLISAVFYGGLANPRAVTSLANVLVSEPKPLQIAGDNGAFAWIDLILIGDKDPLNDKVSNESGTKWQSLHRFYPDNRTLGQLVQFQHIKKYTDLRESGERNQSDVWEILRKRLESSTQKNSITSLSAFCQGAQAVTETLPDVELPQALLECAAGRVGSVSLPSRFLKKWLLKTLDDATPKAFSLSGVQIAWKSGQPKTSLNHGAQNSYSDSGEKRSVDALIKQISAALQTEISGIKNTPARAITRLQEIGGQALTFNAALLVDWLLDCLVTRKIKVSSASRYFSELGSLWLFHTNEADIDDMDESELEQVYRQILTFKPGEKIKSLNYLQARLRDLHRFATQSDHYGLPELTGFFECAGDTQLQPQVRTGYIPEHNYQAMIRGVRNLTGVDRDTKEGLAVLLILAYRTGLRRGELLKLRLSDIEKSDEYWFYVVNNRYGNNKTDSARRRIPVYLLLLPNELERFRQYLNHRLAQNKNHINTLLFSEPHAVSVPYRCSIVSGLTKDLLSFQGLDELSFHHFRHSTLTNIFVVMEENPDLIVTLTGYSVDQAKKIRSELFCSNPMSSRDKYSAIAGLAGHLVPDTTFLYYVHETSLLFWQQLAKFDPVLDKEQISRLSGLSSKAINPYFIANDEAVRLSAMRPEILKRLAPMSRTFKTKTLSTVATEEAPYTPLRPKPTVRDCHAVLRDLEDGDPVLTLSVRYAMDKNKILGWREAAKEIQSLTTKAGNSRHFPKDVVPKAIGIPLAPIRPQDRATAAETDKVISLLRDAYGEDSIGIRWCIEYWKNNTSQAKPGTRFTHFEDAAKFVNSLERVIPKGRWGLNILVAPKVSIEELDTWRSLGISYQMQEVSQGSSVQAYLRLRHINEKEIIGKRKHIKQFSSQLLNYVFHMLAIMVAGSRVGKP
mgnify:CR=1 FL=1|tara:strand:- start:7123 stop:10272 length:3150 start_codon:yes stop_codon:yes gene_type:complete